MMSIRSSLVKTVLRTQVPAVSHARFSTAVPSEEQDVVIIGGGPAGYVAAIKAGQLGLKVTCVEGRGTLGGTCLNVGCIPSKALLNSSFKYHDALHSFKQHGIIVGDVKMDVKLMLKQKEDAVGALTKGIESLFKRAKVNYVKGWGSLKDSRTVEVRLCEKPTTQSPHCQWESCQCRTQPIRTKNIVIASGSDPIEIPFMKYDEKTILSSTGALSLQRVPKKMLVVGAGIIGLELGSVWSRLGAEVSVVEVGDRICPSLDVEIGRTVQKVLEGQGLKFLMNQKVVACENRGEAGGASVTLADAKGQQVVHDVDAVLVAVGRRPFPDKLRAREAGVEIDNRNRIVVDQKWETNLKGVFAVGDIVAGPMLAHKAEEEGIAVIENIAGRHGHVNYDCIPGVLYTHPEVAWVGKSEEELKAAGVEYRVGKFRFAANSRARTMNDTDGLIKILADKKTDRILGVWIVGSQAGEQIAEGVLAMEYGASSEDVARTCHAHPTLSEAFKEACMAAYDRPIHM